MRLPLGAFVISSMRVVHLKRTWGRKCRPPPVLCESLCVARLHFEPIDYLYKRQHKRHMSDVVIFLCTIHTHTQKKKPIPFILTKGKIHHHTDPTMLSVYHKRRRQRDEKKGYMTERMADEPQMCRISKQSQGWEAIKCFECKVAVRAACLIPAI